MQAEPPQRESQVWSVGALCLAMADALNARFQRLTVRGELSQITYAASGHVYFSLKDEEGQIRCAMFRQQARNLERRLSDGLKVTLKGRLSIYSPRGDLQLIVDALQVAGQGDLYEQFLRLKQQLQSEGLFEPARKRELTPYPRRIGLVTSPDGAALHDVLTTLKRHVPHVPVVFSPSLVQGPQAPALLIQALNRLKAVPDVDVVLLVRGGGSLEDLWAFNDEALVRQVAALPWPVITGVGHETDFTLVDFVSDCRAPTPTGAAEMCAWPARACHDQLDQWDGRMRERMQTALNQAQQRLDQCSQALKQPRVRLHDWQRGLDRITWQLRQALTLSIQTHQSRLRDRVQRHAGAFDQALVKRRNQLSHWAVRLEALNPDHVLSRGFVRLSDPSGAVVASVHQVKPGDAVLAHFHDGEAGMQVESKRSF